MHITTDIYILPRERTGKKQTIPTTYDEVRRGREDRAEALEDLQGLLRLVLLQEHVRLSVFSLDKFWCCGVGFGANCFGGGGVVCVYGRERMCVLIFRGEMGMGMGVYVCVCFLFFGG